MVIILHYAVFEIFLSRILSRILHMFLYIVYVSQLCDINESISAYWNNIQVRIEADFLRWFNKDGFFVIYHFRFLTIPFQ